MQQVKIVFKSGAIIDIEVEEMTVERNTVTNEINGIDWEGVKDKLRPFYMRLENIDGIFVKDVK